MDQPFDCTQLPPQLGPAVEQRLCTPLEALRASMEALSAEYDELDPRARLVRGALEEVLRLGRGVRELAELTHLPRPSPLACTTDEILYTARFHLCSGHRERVVIAREGEVPELFIDGPLLSRCLGRLMEHAFESGAAEVLLGCRCGECQTQFSVVGGAPRGEALCPGRPCGPTASCGLGLAAHLVERDAALLGGRYERVATDRGRSLTRLRVPNAAPRREEAA